METVTLPDGLSVPDIMGSIKHSTPATVYLSGSLVDGFATQESDVDVYVLLPDSEEPWDGLAAPEGRTYVLSGAFVGNVRLDIEYRLLSVIESMRSRLDLCSFQDHRPAAAIPRREMRFLHDLLIGQPLVGHSLFAELRAGIDRQKLAAAIHWDAYIVWSQRVEDTAGLLNTGDLRTAFLTVQEALDCAMDAFIARQGETNPSPKWRFRKLERLQEFAWMDRYWACRTRTVNPEDLRAYIEDCLRLANDLILQSQAPSEI